MQKKTFFLVFANFHTHTNSQDFINNQIGHIQIFKNNHRHQLKPFGAKIYMKTKVTKVLLTRGISNPYSVKSIKPIAY